MVPVLDFPKYEAKTKNQKPKTKPKPNFKPKNEWFQFWIF